MTSKKKNKPAGRRGARRNPLYPIIGACMIPLCIAAGKTLWHMLGGGSHPFQDISASTPAWFFCGGLLLWVFTYGILPRPVRIYVLGHELTHALGAWISGGSARRFRVGAKGGSVMVTSDNFFVVLAPYFFPIYSALLLAAYFCSALFIDPQPRHSWWMAALGISWGFHLTFTISALWRPQSDINIYGALFSYGMILFLNLVMLALGLVLVASPTLEDWTGVFSDEIIAVFRHTERMGELLKALGDLLNAVFRQ